MDSYYICLESDFHVTLFLWDSFKLLHRPIVCFFSSIASFPHMNIQQLFVHPQLFLLKLPISFPWLTGLLVSPTILHSIARMVYQNGPLTEWSFLREICTLNLATTSILTSLGWIWGWRVQLKNFNAVYTSCTAKAWLLLFKRVYRKFIGRQGIN